MPKPLKRFFLIAAVLVLAAAAVIFYAVIEPKSDIGFRLFRLRYDTATNKPHFLAGFSQELDDFEGGTIPVAIDNYLVARFTSAASETERAGIVDFYVRQQAYGRPGYRLRDMGEPFVALLFQRLPQYDSKQQLAAIAAIEGCRRGESVHKFYFTPLASAVEHHQLPVETVIGAYEHWWHMPLPWAQKIGVNPISELSYDWSEP